MPTLPGSFLDDLPMAGLLAPGDEILVQQSGVSKRSTISALPIPTAGNPTAQVGLVAVNGSGSTFMRANAAPALSQAIVPSWTGQHKFVAPSGTVKAIFKAAAGETANLVEFQLSSSVAQSYVDPFCRFWAGDFTNPMPSGYIGMSAVMPDATPAFQFATTAGGGQACRIGTDYPNRRGFFALSTSVDFGWQWKGATFGQVMLDLDRYGQASHVITDAVTAAINVGMLLRHNTSGTAAAGFGNSLRMQLDSTTTPDRDAAAVEVSTVTATDASRKYRLTLSAWDTAQREGFRIEGTGSAAGISFFGNGVATQQTVTGLLASAVTVADLVATLQSLLAALATQYGLVIDGTT